MAKLNKDGKEMKVFPVFVSLWSAEFVINM